MRDSRTTSDHRLASLLAEWADQLDEAPAWLVRDIAKEIMETAVGLGHELSTRTFIAPPGVVALPGRQAGLAHESRAECVLMPGLACLPPAGAPVERSRVPIVGPEPEPRWPLTRTAAIVCFGAGGGWLIIILVIAGLVR